MQTDPIDALCERLGYRFKDKKLLMLALTHCSFCGTKGQNNQRLEFLGDAVLGFVVSEQLYHQANADEGHLSRMRARIVCEASLAEAAKGLDLSPLIQLGRGEETTGGRDKPSILADLMEAILGAVFLDGGLECARECALGVMRESIEQALQDGGGQDHKTALQQLCASLQKPAPTYEMISMEGPPHAPKFTVGICVEEKSIAKGTGKSKKEAEQQAARLAIRVLQNKDRME